MVVENAIGVQGLRCARSLISLARRVSLLAHTFMHIAPSDARRPARDGAELLFLSIVFRHLVSQPVETEMK